MISHVDILTTWADRWRALRAWGRPLTEVAIRVIPRRTRHGSVLGRAHPAWRQIEIRVSGDLVEDLATALHELAHVAAPAGAHHNEPWRRRFAAAVSEVTGITIPDPGPGGVVDALARDAIGAWWRRSGNEATVALLCPVGDTRKKLDR